MAIYNLENYLERDGVSFPKNFRRGNPNPLDNSSVWASLDAAKNYAKTDPVAYVGQILSVVDNANGIVDVYKINDTAGNLVLVGTVTLGDDQSIVKNDDDTLSLYDFGKKYYKFVAANGDVAAHYEATEGWKDGLEPKVSGGVLAWYEPNPTTVDGLQSSINTLRADVDTNKESIKANTDAIAVLNGDKDTEGSVAYQIAAVVAGANADFDTLKEIADWIAAHPDSVATINAAIKGNTDAIDALEELVGTDAVVDQIASAIDALNITQYAKADDLGAAIEDISANVDDIEALQGLVGEGTVDERIDAAVKETVGGVKQDKFALREHGHVVADIDGLGARLDTLATKDTVNGIDGRVQAIENGLGTAIDAAIQTHNEAADLKYETIENVSLLSGQIDTKVAELEKADTDNLAAAKAHAEEKIAELNITQYAKQADLDDTNAAIDAIKDHADVDSFADVMAKIAEKQDTIPANTYDSHGSAAAVDAKLDAYKTATNKRLDDLEAEMDAAVGTLEAADAAILAKIGSVADGKTVVGLIAAAQEAADNAQEAADTAQDEIDALETLVGAIPEGSDTVIAYINKKAEEVLNAVVGESDETIESVSAALDGYKEENNKKVEAAAGAAATAQSRADAAHELATSKATMDEVNTAIANAGHAVAADVDSAIKGINDKIGEVPAGSTVMAEIAKAQADATYDDTEVLEKLNTLIGEINEDATKSVRDIATEVLTGVLVGADEAYDTLEEVSAWIQNHPHDASEMNKDINALKNKVDTGDKTVSKYIADAKQEAIDAAASDATSKADAAKSAAEDYADGLNTAMSARVDALEAIDHDHANKAELDLIASGDKAKWDDAANKAHEHANAAELAKIADGDVAKWNSAQANAEATASAALDTAKTELEGDIADAEKAAKDHADTEVGKVQTALDTYKTANDTVVAGKADKATTLAGYGIADAMTADQINALLTWGSF